ncbi:hypothetical protein B0H13DRAFT_1865261 [Mycena leptocephala]|nr:hypothetical protein B0H13DRAFT_1865261 [Mycena leptocephala]
MCMKDGRPAAHTTRRPQTETKITHHRRKINHRTPLLPKPRQLPRLPYPPPLRQHCKESMTEHEPKEGEQDNAVCEQREVAGGFQRRSGAGDGVREKEEGHEEVAHFLKREREVRAEEREEEMHRESEEQAEDHT